MTTALFKAEAYWISRKRALKVGAALAALLAAAQVAMRTLSTSSDLAEAVSQAEADVARLAEQGLDVPLSAVFVEVRYLAMAQLPVDIAGYAIVLALVGFVIAGLDVGGSWRTGVVRLSLVNASERHRPAAIRILAWWIAWSGTSIVALVALALGLTLLAHSTGDPNPASFDLVVGLLVRSVLVGGAGALLGAALATILRSDTSAVVVGLGYVLVGEILLPALAAGGTYRSPGARLVDFVLARDLTQPSVPNCGAPRCDEVFPATGPPLIVFAAILGVLLALALIASHSAQRAIWR